jgi:ribosomal protein L30/L7E
MYASEKQKLKAMLNHCRGKISLTSDLWSSLTTDGYICIIAHYVDTNWVLQKRVLNFSFMVPPFNRASLCEKVLTMIQEWGIDTKLFSITLDNASSNDNFVVLLKDQLNFKKVLVSSSEFFHLDCWAHILNLIVQNSLKEIDGALQKVHDCVKYVNSSGEFFQLHCWAHILNLIVKDGLKEIDGALQKVRDCVKYVKGSQVRKQKFMQAMNQMSINSKIGLKQDVSIIWNSTYLILVSVIHY